MRWTVLALVGLLAAGSASAGGVGTELPEPLFESNEDDRAAEEAMLTSVQGAPAPRWVRVDDPGRVCVNPKLDGTNPSHTTGCARERLALPIAGCDCEQRPADPDLWDCTDHDAVMASFPLQDAGGAGEPCRPDFIESAQLPLSVVVERNSVRVVSADDYDVYSQRFIATVFIESVEDGRLRYEFPAGDQPPHYVIHRRGVGYETEPLLIDQIGWLGFNDAVTCNALDDAVERAVERVAAGRTFGGLPRAALIEYGQQQLPEELCQEDDSGACSFTPALALVDDDGGLSQVEDADDPATAVLECRFQLRFAKPLTHCNDGLDNETDVPEGLNVLGGPIVNPANGHSYYLLGGSTWEDAETASHSLGGHLVTINDPDENEWVYGQFSDGEDRNLWIGLNDAAQEDSFVWASGESSDFRKWNLLGDEPDGEDYVVILGPSFQNPTFWADVANDPSGVPAHGVVEASGPPGDGMIDFPDDPGCSGPYDASECDDGLETCPEPDDGALGALVAGMLAVLRRMTTRLRRE